MRVVPKRGNGYGKIPKCVAGHGMIWQIARADRFKVGVQRSCHAQIFSEGHEAFRKTHAKILVTHEAPSTYRHGSATNEEVARNMQVQLVVHGPSAPCL